MKHKLLPIILLLALLWASTNPTGSTGTALAQGTDPEWSAPLVGDVQQPVPLGVYAEHSSPDGPEADGSGYSYAECDRADSAGIEAEIEEIALAVMQDAGRGLDIGSLVAREWARLDLDRVVDQEIEVAIAAVKGEEPYWERLLSSWSPQKAEELAQRAATLAFESPVLQAEIETLADAVAQDLTAEVDAIMAQSASTALLCMQAYVGAVYSQTLFQAFQAEIEQEIAPLEHSQLGDLTLSPVDMHKKAIGGAGIILVSQVTRKVVQALSKKIAGRMAGKVAGRVLGRLGSSVVPIVGWAIGAGLIVWDLVEGTQGALPQIQTALQSEEVKVAMRLEIATAIEEGLTAEVDMIAVTMASALMDEWQGFCARHASVCTLAEENSAFRSLLAVTALSDLWHVASWVDTWLAVVPPAELGLAVDDGTFERLARLPESAQILLVNSVTPADIIAWQGLAGQHFDKVVEYEIYQYVTPADISTDKLAVLLETGDGRLIAQLLALDAATQTALLQLSGPTLAAFAADLSAGDLTWLGDYLAQAEPDDVALLGEQLAEGSTTVARLRAPVAEPTVPPVEQPVAQVLESREVPIESSGPFGGYTVLIVAAVLSVLLVAGRIFLSRRSAP